MTGEIVIGEGALDKAPLTGESAPVEVSVGDEIGVDITSLKS